MMASRLSPSARARMAHLLRSGRDTYAEVAERFGTSRSTVYEVARSSGIVRHRRWDDSELAFLRDNYWEHGARRCADVLGRDYQCVSKKARELGLSTRVGPYGKWRVMDGGRGDGKP